MMVDHAADDVPGTVEFLTRYSKFWGGANIVIHDVQKRSAAIEKCSYNFIEVFHPGADGCSHISGMVCRDPQSPQGRYQRQKRLQYLNRIDLRENGPDATFWAACDKAEQMLTDGLADMGKQAKLDDLIKLFITPWPDGLDKEGKPFHPQQRLVEYTLVTHLSLIDEKIHVRWQRDEVNLSFPEEAEVYRFGDKGCLDN